MMAGKLEYGDLRHLPRLLKAALHEALANPARVDEIAEALAGDAEQLHAAYAREVTVMRSLRRSASEDAKEWEQKYRTSRRFIKLQAKRITDNWVLDGAGDGFNPQGFFVYLLWDDATPNVPIYVGQSGNVCTRIGQHLASGCRYSHRISRVTLIRCDSQEQMCITEQELIDLYQPELNRKGKRVEAPTESFAGRYALAPP